MHTLVALSVEKYYTALTEIKLTICGFHGSFAKKASNRLCDGPQPPKLVTFILCAITSVPIPTLFLKYVLILKDRGFYFGHFNTFNIPFCTKEIPTTNSNPGYNPGLLGRTRFRRN
ncbi:unnamed protein product [Clavelina lepadiformis]|uniref:Uncharacterized protein n=1 Tax=Clavelina lepadiformis TaxID=159417 RepID=A0ABP0F2F6_CLALP